MLAANQGPGGPRKTYFVALYLSRIQYHEMTVQVHFEIANAYQATPAAMGYSMKHHGMFIFSLGDTLQKHQLLLLLNEPMLPLFSGCSHANCIKPPAITPVIYGLLGKGSGLLFTQSRDDKSFYQCKNRVPAVVLALFLISFCLLMMGFHGEMDGGISASCCLRDYSFCMCFPLL